MKEIFNNLGENLEWMTSPLFSFNNTDFSILKIITICLLLIFIYFFSEKMKYFLLNKILIGKRISYTTKYAIATFTRYLIILLGTFFILDQIGIDISTLSVALGALGVGIGFGLQNIVNNLFSGFIIFFEKPIKIGDRVELTQVEGNVVEINLRSTIIKTNDNVRYIVPNSEFISKTVINWSHKDPRVRRRIKVGVSYKEDPEEVKKLLLEVADEEPMVLKEPGADVLFKSFGDNALIFELRVWTESMASKPGVLTSNINYKLSKKFKENNITIPFPQRDVHIIKESE